MSKREIGDMVVFDVTAGGNMLPGELKDMLGNRIFLCWVRHDGERAKVIDVSPKGQCTIKFDDGYAIKGISCEYFIKDETLAFGIAPEEGVPLTEPTMKYQVDEMEKDQTNHPGVYDEPACTEMPEFCDKCVAGKAALAKLRQDENGFMVCPGCGVSYGKVTLEEEQDAEKDT